MSQSTKPKKPSRERKRITRTACEPCREKRAKVRRKSPSNSIFLFACLTSCCQCDGQKPCERCQTRGLDCQFIQRAWASKRSLQDESALLRVKLLRRDRVLDVLAQPGLGDEVLKMLRTQSLSADDIYDLLEKRADQEPRPSCKSCGKRDCDSFCSPSTVAATTVSASSQNLSPNSFAESLAEQEQSTTPLSPMVNQQIPQRQSPSSTHQSQRLAQTQRMQQQMMWNSPHNTMGATVLTNNTAPRISMTTEMPENPEGGPQVIDPMLWPPNAASASLGQPWMTSWAGLCNSQGLYQDQEMNTATAMSNVMLSGLETQT